jgi:hypothetical protein
VAILTAPPHAPSSELNAANKTDFICSLCLKFPRFYLAPLLELERITVLRARKEVATDRQHQRHEQQSQQSHSVFARGSS